MCAEKDPMACHRSILICRNLRDRLIDIRHIIDHDTTETQADLEKRLVSQLRLYPDFFKDTDPNALIERAYEIQGDQIAYVEKGEPGQDEKLAEAVREEHERY
jgi:beta-galactosidase beta subunit